MSESSVMQACRRMLTEPVTQFLLIGALVYMVVGSGSPPAAPELRITAAQQQLLSAQFERNNRRPPSAEELQSLIEQRTDELVLVREAQSLALDQGDEIVRRRLLQKMEFLLQSRAQPAAPSPEQLREYFRAHAERYTQPAQFSFEHIYFRHSAQAEAVATALLKSLSPSAAGGSAGDHFDYGYRFVNRSLTELRNIFGPSFIAGLQTAPNEAAWFGPVPSLYGQHLLRISSMNPAAPPAFAKESERVYADWLEDEQKRLLAVQTKALRERYDVQIEPRDGR